MQQLKDPYFSRMGTTSVHLSANLSMGMFAMIRAQSPNLLLGFE